MLVLFVCWFIRCFTSRKPQATTTSGYRDGGMYKGRHELTSDHMAYADMTACHSTDVKSKKSPPSVMPLYLKPLSQDTSKKHDFETPLRQQRNILGKCQEVVHEEVWSLPDNAWHMTLTANIPDYLRDDAERYWQPHSINLDRNTSHISYLPLGTQNLVHI